MAAMAVKDKESGSVLELWWDGEASERLNVNVRHVGQTNKVVTVSRKTQVHSPFHLYKVKQGLIKIKHANYPTFRLFASYGKQ